MNHEKSYKWIIWKIWRENKNTYTACETLICENKSIVCVCVCGGGHVNYTWKQMNHVKNDHDGSKSVMMVLPSFLFLTHLSVVSTHFPLSTASVVKVVITILIIPGDREQRQSWTGATLVFILARLCRVMIKASSVP